MSFVAAQLESSAENAERTAASVRRAAGQSEAIVGRLLSAREVTWESAAATGFRGVVDTLMVEAAADRTLAESVADDLLAAATDLREWAAGARSLSAALDGASPEDLAELPLIGSARDALEDPSSFVRFVADGGVSTVRSLLS
ncbi:MAG: hypothetical protein Q4F53_05130 [Nesterenkonia sp.]|uniref:hypothetical protein n=1 Tax=Nesterenkonia marinintestina TaxID=2979865 RepID=UPI0021C1C8BD|nr:hypothetical protein [Nesterenkonia sp. GX14115]MDO5492977.1 hypothetical protein [Nesterenkonia sp.]